MNDLTVTSAAGKSDLTVVVIGHCAARLPKLVNAQAVRIAKGEASAPMLLVAGEGSFLLVKPDEKAWLVGGDNWRLLGREIVDAMRTSRAKTATVLLQGKTANPQALVEGLVLGDYRYNALRSGKEGKRSQLTVRLPGHAAAVEDGSSIAQCQNLARELSDTPPNLLDPQTFAARAKSELRASGLSVKVTSGTRQLRKAGFPGLAQVGMAGASEPALVEIHYQPKRSAIGHGRRIKMSIEPPASFSSSPANCSATGRSPAKPQGTLSAGRPARFPAAIKRRMPGVAG